MTKEDDIKIVRHYVNQGKICGKRFLYLPALISNHEDNNFYIALDELNRLGNMNSRRTKEEIINRILDWYEYDLGKGRSEGL